MSSSRVSNSDASLANSSSRSGRTRSLTSLTVDARTAVLGLVLVVVLVVGAAAPGSGVELEVVAGVGADEVLVDLGDDAAGADLVEVVLGGELGDAARRPGVPAMSMVTKSPSIAGRSTLGELAELGAQALELRRRSPPRRARSIDGDPQAAVAGHLDRSGAPRPPPRRRPAPDSSPPVSSSSGAAMTSTSCSFTASA